MIDHVINNLWLGSQQDADELVRNNPEKITAILNVRGPDAYKPPGRDQASEHPGKAYKWIPAPDTGVIYPEPGRGESCDLGSSRRSAGYADCGTCQARRISLRAHWIA